MRAIRTDALLVAIFLALGCLLGATYVRLSRQAHLGPVMPAFNQRVFGAALMQACGRGLTTPAVSLSGPAASPDHQPLIDFLAQRRESIACVEIPDRLPVDGLDGLQSASRYLLAIVAGAWVLGGPAWASIDGLMGVLFAISVALGYVTCRLAMGRWLASAIAGVFLLSPMQLSNLTDVRDYSKAPFFLASLLVVGFITIRERRAAVVVGVSAVAGALLGFGFGVRTDVVINLFLVLVAIVAFLPSPVSRSWRVRVVAAAACIGSFAAVASPLLNLSASGPGIWHWALLGQAHRWDQGLEVAPSVYETGYFYDDSYPATTVDAFWARVSRETAPVSYGSPLYREASRAYYLAILNTFPADALLRGWAALVQVLNLPYNGMHSFPPGVLPRWWGNLVETVGLARVWFADLGGALFATAVIVVSLQSLRLGALLFTAVAFLGAYTAIQFQLRHVFQLEFLSLWILGFLVSRASVYGMSRYRAAVSGSPANPESPYSRPQMVLRPVIIALAVVVTVVLPLAILRLLQQGRATELFNTYESAHTEPVPVSTIPVRPGLLRLVAAWPPSRQRPVRSMMSEMLVADVSSIGCPVSRPSLTFRYAAQRAEVDFTRTYSVDVAADGAPTRVFFPVYETGSTNPNPELLAFGGIDVVESQRPCLKSVSRFTDPDHFPLLLPAVLAPAWRDRPLHYTLRAWERDVYQGAAATYWSPATLSDQGLALQAMNAVGAASSPGAITYQARIAQAHSDGSVVVNGVGDGPGSYLVAWSPRAMTGSDLLVASGRIARGGLTVGLTDESGWVARVDIDVPGPFRAVLQPPRPGVYQVIVANFLSNTSQRNHFEFSRIGVINGEP